MLVMLFFDNFTPEGCAINNPTRKCGENEIPPLICVLERRALY